MTTFLTSNDRIVNHLRPHIKLSANNKELSTDLQKNILTWHKQRENYDSDGLIRWQPSTTNYAADIPYQPQKGVIELWAPGTYLVNAGWEKAGAMAYGQLTVSFAGANEATNIINDRTFTGFRDISFTAGNIGDIDCLQTTCLVHVYPVQVPGKLLVSASSNAPTAGGKVYSKGCTVALGDDTGETLGSYVDITYLGA